MKEIVLITGANGMVAKKLSKILSDSYTIRFLTRNKTLVLNKKNEFEWFEWNVEKKHIDSNALKNVHHIIHLAGAGIVDKKWTEARKKVIVSSRVDSTKLILSNLKKQKIKIISFLSASAIGYYGTETTNNVYTEIDKKGADFLSDVCNQWENEAQLFEKENIAKRTIILRIGIVLSKKGGALKKIATPIKFFAGAVLGKGNQYMPWIHIDDLCFICKHLLENLKLKGVFNAVSPERITNKEFTYKLAKHLNRPILLPNIPSFVLTFIFGKRAVLLLKGSRVSSQKIINTGFTFMYDTFKKALQNL